MTSEFSKSIMCSGKKYNLIIAENFVAHLRYLMLKANEMLPQVSVRENMVSLSIKDSNGSYFQQRASVRKKSCLS